MDSNRVDIEVYEDLFLNPNDNNQLFAYNKDSFVIWDLTQEKISILINLY